MFEEAKWLECMEMVYLIQLLLKYFIQCTMRAIYTLPNDYLLWKDMWTNSILSHSTTCIICRFVAVRVMWYILGYWIDFFFQSIIMYSWMDLKWEVKRILNKSKLIDCINNCKRRFFFYSTFFFCHFFAEWITCLEKNQYVKNVAISYD